jgi:hypothetical protein
MAVSVIAMRCSFLRLRADLSRCQRFTELTGIVWSVREASQLGWWRSQKPSCARGSESYRATKAPGSWWRFSIILGLDHL